MSSYQSGSTPTVSGFDTQTPKPLPASAFGSVSQISSSVIAKNPDSIIVVGSGSFHFQYSVTASVGTAVDSGSWDGHNGGVALEAVYGYVSQSVELPISPCAWSGSGAAVATDQSVTFVYKGGL